MYEEKINNYEREIQSLKAKVGELTREIEGHNQTINKLQAEL